MISCVFISAVIARLLQLLAFESLKTIKFNRQLLEQAKNSLTKLQGMLDDARNVEIAINEKEIWLRLQISLYYAEHRLDEIEYNTKTESSARRSTLNKVSNFMWSGKSHDNRKDLEQLLFILDFELQIALGRFRSMGMTEPIGASPEVPASMSCSLVAESVIFGRDKEKESILKVLLSHQLEASGGDNKIRVVSIVGKSGIGKTTLAQLIYNDARVQAYFHVKDWVCVPDDFDLYKMGKDILRGVDVSSMASATSMGMEQLQAELQKKLADQKFLIVLDDFWYQNDSTWYNFVKLLETGAPGSCLIVTAQCGRAGPLVGHSSLLVQLEELSDDYCWKLFCHLVLSDKNLNRNPRLVELGQELVKKCGGLPLCVKALGCLLRSVRNVDEWENILGSSLWDSAGTRVLPILRLSYEYLPPYLQRCFSYCAILPEDHQIQKEELVLRWIAEGLVHQYEDKDAKEVGAEYFDELLSRSFFEPRNYGYERCFVMHELMLDLAQSMARECTGGTQVTRKVPANSLFDESTIFGRKAKKESLIELILSDDMNDNNIRVVSIVGVGGIGKTTLAQLVYREEKVQDSFDFMAWISVPRDFDAFNIIKQILKEFSSMCYHNMTLEQLMVKLERQMVGKRFLLVLDNVCRQSSDEWERLLTPLRSGALGSWLIVTTRHYNVGLLYNKPLYSISELNPLSSDDSWQLFCNHAFAEESYNWHPSLEKIGREIVQTCRGHPLALKVLGGVLHSMRSLVTWEKVLSDLRHGRFGSVYHPIKLCYHFLPSYLKPCFAYCTLFPYGYEFQKDELVLLWMAEGFVPQVQNKEIREVAEAYFDELVSRSIFELRINSYKSCFVLHDLVRDINKHIVKEDCIFLEGNRLCELTSPVRHLSWVRSTYPYLQEGFLLTRNNQYLHTLLVVSQPWLQLTQDHTNMLLDLLPKLRCLRVLSLSQCQDVSELLCSISSLKHLHYLDFSKTAIKSLPESFCDLYYLQTLKLNQCRQLIELPANVEKLTNMLHLDIEGTSLQEMPPNMGRLTKLQNLSNFLVGELSDCSIKELGQLKHLRGSLAIRNLENVVNVGEALEANLKERKHLQELILEWSCDTDDPVRDKGVLDGLQPHIDVEKVSVIGYGGLSFPNWVGDSSFMQLVTLKLVGCKYCSSLPQLGHMSTLKNLQLRGFDSVEVVDSAFYGKFDSSSIKPFQSLEILRFEKMPQLQEWIPYGKGDDGGAFPLLRKLSIVDCPNLKGALPVCLPSLKELHVIRCWKLEFSFPKAPKLTSMILENGSCSIEFSHSRSLKFVQFNSQRSMVEMMEKLGTARIFASEKVVIRRCESLRCFPSELFPGLRILEVESCPNLQIPCPNFKSFAEELSAHMEISESLPECMHSVLSSIVELKIDESTEIARFRKGGLPSKLQSLSISNCDKLVSGFKHWNLQNLSSLSDLEISEYGGMEVFPEEILFPSSLTSLRILFLPNVKNLQYTKFHQITSLSISDLQIFESLFDKGTRYLNLLEKLEIRLCPELLSLPTEGLPSSLTSLKIYKLRNLKSVEGLAHLIGLKILEIFGCRNLQLLPESLPSSLFYLSIWDCPLLKERIQRDSGEDWPKISNIPAVEVNGYNI